MMRLWGILLPAILLGSVGGAAECVYHCDFSTEAGDWKLSGKSRLDSGRLHVDGRIDFCGDSRMWTERIRKWEAVSFEVWFRPANRRQEGPARIFTLSRDTSHRNFTLGQEKDRVSVRLRTTGTTRNGLPDLSSDAGSLGEEWTHCVFVFEAGRESVLYLDGEEAARRRIEGDLSNWDPEFPIGIGDENHGGRGWKGRIASLGIWEGALDADSVLERFEAGRDARPEDSNGGGEPGKSENERLFERRITTLLTTHCLECHDSATQDGDLDLSRPLDSHFDDGILVRGDAGRSLLWESIENDDMPHDRAPLSAEEKSLVRQWIDGGASWSVEFVDPAIYSRPALQAATQSRRLTRAEYTATIRDVFGVDLASEVREFLPPEVRSDGFSNTAYNLKVDLKHVEGYARIARNLVEELDTRDFARKFARRLDLTDKAMIPLIESMGEFVLRGPLSTEEVALYRGVSTSVASAGGGFEEAVGYVIEAMVQSPRFLYRLERAPRGNRPRPASDYEIASRLGYTIWGSAPDHELLRRAREGRLSREGEIRDQIARMLTDPRAVEQSRRFVSDWLHLDRLSHLQPNREHFPDWSPELAESMREETLAFFEEVVWNRERPLSALLNEPVGFLTEDLARHYGIAFADSGEGAALSGPVRVDLSESESRGGILTQGSVLTIGGDEASMVTRGLFVLNDLLRGVIQDPPPCVDTTPVASRPGRTQRLVAMERVASSSCGGCHSKFEPLAYGLERFDGLGSFRLADEYGNALRQDGEVLFPGEAEPRTYETIAELMDLLAASDRVAETITWKYVQFAMGRPLNARDAVHVEAIHTASIAGGGTYPALVEALAVSPLLRESFPGEQESD